MTQYDWEYLKKYLPEEIRHEVINICLRNLLSDVEKDRLIFWIVWEWAIKREWWDKFLFFSRINMDDILDSEGAEPVSHSCMGLVNPTRFLQLITDFLREKEKGEGDAND